MIAMTNFRIDILSEQGPKGGVRENTVVNAMRRRKPNTADWVDLKVED